MKILKKRAIAIFIDSFLIGSMLVILSEILSIWRLDLWNLDFFIVVILFCSKDFVFRNASIGKKVAGIAIYDNDWKSPKIKSLFKRSAFMTTVGLFVFIKAFFIDGMIINLFDWERDALGTRVVDKKILKNMQQKVGKNHPEKITELYNEYLRELYVK